MSIYLVKEVSGNQKPTTLLSDRGLNAKTTTMTILSPKGLPDFAQPAYRNYTTVIPAFMLATKENIVIPTTRTGYFLIDQYKNCLQVPYPPLAISFKNKLSADEEVAMQARGAGVIGGDKTETPVYTFGSDSVDAALLDFIAKHPKKANDNNFVPIGAVNIKGITALHRTMIILTWFLKTHSYPGFSGPVDDADESAQTFDTIEGFMSTKRKGTFANRGGKRIRTEEGEEAIDMEEDEDSRDYGLVEVQVGDSADKIPKAKPSNPPSSIAGLANTIPTLPGLSFPYFEGMIDSDPMFVAKVIEDYFFESLADNREGIFSAFKTLSSGLSQLAKTKTGNILQHVFVGVKLAIKCQARLYPLLEDKKYIGFTLHGWYFTLSIDGYKRVPKLYPELLKEVQLIDEHAIAVGKIYEFLAKKKLSDTKKRPGIAVLKELKASLDGPRTLNSHICKFELDDDDKLEIEKLSNLLSFPQRFWDFSVENIIKAIKYLSDEDTLPTSEPMFTRGGVLTSDDKAIDVFSAFGENGFSFRMVGGEHKMIPKDVASDVLFKPYKGKNDKTVHPQPPIIVAKKNLVLCVADWKALVGDHMVHLKKNRDSPFKNVVFGGVKGKSLWYALIENVGSVELSEIVSAPATGINLGDDEVEDGEVHFSMFL